MSIIGRLASSSGRNDEELNIRLAEELVKGKNFKGIAELVENLFNHDQSIASDSIKVLYEVAYRAPELVEDYWESFLRLLTSKNNRMVWGGAIALATIAALRHRELYKHLDTIKKAYQNGSVITVDSCISIFAELAKADKKKEAELLPLLLQHLETCRPKEVAQHAERIAVCVNAANAEVFKVVLQKRYVSLTAPQKKRVDTLLRRL